MLQCSSCGEKLPERANYCPLCGSSRIADSEDHAGSESAPRSDIPDALANLIEAVIDDQLDYFERAWGRTAERGPPEGYPGIASDIELFLLGYVQGYLRAIVSDSPLEGAATAAGGEENPYRGVVYPFIQRRKDRIRSICGIPEWSEY